MAPRDWTHHGNVTARAWFTNVVVSILLLGVQLFLCTYALIVLLETPRPRRRGRWPYILLVFVLFILSAIPISMDAALLFFSLFEATSPADFVTKSSTQSRLEWMRSLGQTVPSNLLIFVGDGLLLYRCYMVCTDARWFVVLPTLLYMATFVFGILSLVPSISSAASGNMTYGGICIILSVIMNLFITGTISSRLLAARHAFSQALPDRSKGIILQYTSIVAILVESALPLSVFGLVYSIIIATTKGTDSNVLQKEVAIYVFSVLYFSFAALSPQMIIFRVTTGRSWTGELQRSIEELREGESSGEVSSGMIFASLRSGGNFDAGESAVNVKEMNKVST